VISVLKLESVPASADGSRSEAADISHYYFVVVVVVVVVTIPSESSSSDIPLTPPPWDAFSMATFPLYGLLLLGRLANVI